MPPSAMCPSVCYLFVSLVSSTATWWLSGLFSLVVVLSTSSLFIHWFFVVRCESCGVDVLPLSRLLVFGHLLLALLSILLILLLAFAAKLTERVAIFALFVFLGPIRLLVVLLVMRLLR